MTDKSPLPQDQFSITRRGLTDNPGAHASGSTIYVQDFYGNLETWIVETWRVDGRELVLLQVSGANPTRLVLPMEVTRALARQREQVATATRRRLGHDLIERRRQRGDRLGNPEALARARKAKK